MSYECVQKSRNNRKKDMVYVMGEKCQICGYNRDIHALEFHHLNPTEKDFAFNKAVSISWEKIENELKKCVLLCANCHREIHSGCQSLELKSSYNKNRADEITQKIIDFKSKTIKKCLVCGKILSSNSSLCVDCANKEKQKVERPTREQLKELIRKSSFYELGKKFGVSDNAIRKWCKKEKLPYKTSEIKTISDIDWLKI